MKRTDSIWIGKPILGRELAHLSRSRSSLFLDFYSILTGQDNEAWLVMDFVGGGSVSDILEACEVTLSEAEAKECTAWTVLALDYLHSNRKLHRVR